MGLVNNLIIGIHIFCGFVALVSGLVSLVSAKGKSRHRAFGKIYVYAMTGVFVSGLYVAIDRDNHFLFLIAFLSFYSVFAGVRALKLKNLHRGQVPEKIDWIAGGINTLANLVFVGLGIFYWLKKGGVDSSVILTIGFGVGGLLISYTNLHPFFRKPDKSWHWYLSHNGNMMGGYIATLTAFISTTVTRYEFMDPFLAFALPSLIGIPLLIYWQGKIEKEFMLKIKSNQ